MNALMHTWPRRRVSVFAQGRVGWGNTPTFFRKIDSWENLLDVSLIYWMYHLVYYLS